MTEGSSPGKGLLASMRGFAGTLTEIAQTRLAILASDLEEQGASFTRIAIYAAIGAASLFCALVMAIVFVIVASGEHRLVALAILFALFFAVALWSLAMLKRHVAARPRLLAATLAELEKDKSALSGRHEANR